MMLKLTFPLRLREFIDILKVQLPTAEFIEPLSDILCIPCISRFKKSFQERLNDFYIS